MAWQLVPGADEERAIPLDKAILFFGRHPECDVVITRSRKVSRKHCCIVQINDEFVVRDLGSMNGVRVNGKIIRRQSPLRVGDSLTVGDVVFHLKESAAKKPRPPARRRAQPSQAPSRPLDVSQDVPVIISEQEQSFSVEESLDGELIDEAAADDVSGKTPLDVDAEET